MNDEFKLFDLCVSVEGDPTTFACSHELGENFTVHGENIVFNKKKNSYSLYALSALLPLLPVKQRETNRFDWISTDDLIACPDPNCGARFNIKRVSQSAFHHSDVTKTVIDG